MAFPCYKIVFRVTDSRYPIIVYIFKSKLKKLFSRELSFYEYLYCLCPGKLDNCAEFVNFS